MQRITTPVLTIILSLGLLAGCGGGSGPAPVTAPPATPVPEPGLPPVTPDPVPDPGPSLPDTRDLAGRIETPQGLPVSGATIQVSTGDTIVADGGGDFLIPALPMIEVQLVIEAPGFTSLETVLPSDWGTDLLVLVLEPLPVDVLGPLAIEAAAGLGGTVVDIEAPGPNIPYDYFLYRRTPEGTYDWAAPLNSEPLRQVLLDPHGHAASAMGEESLSFTDTGLVGGLEYRYTVRVRDLDGRFGPPQPETGVKAAGFGPPTSLLGASQDKLLDTAPGADGSLVALYRDMSYGPWHRFIARRFDGQGQQEEIFRVQGVFDDAEVFVDRFEVPYFFYRRNGIEFLFETYLLNFYDQYGLSPDLRIGQAYRKNQNGLAGQMMFRPDPEGKAAQELVAVYVNRDRQVVAQTWDHGTMHTTGQEILLGLADSTIQPRLMTIQNRQGAILTAWNRDFTDSAYWDLAFLPGQQTGTPQTLGTGFGMAITLGTTADDQFLVAFTRANVTTGIQLYRYQPDGTPTGEKSLDLSEEGAYFNSGMDQFGMTTLPNGRSYLAALVMTGAGERELRAWDITDFAALKRLGAIRFSHDSPVPATIQITQDYAGQVHLVATENNVPVYRRLFWPER